MEADAGATGLSWLAAAHRDSASQSNAVPGDASLDDDILRLYDQYAASLSRFVIGATEDEELAGEVVQECFLRYVTWRRNGGREADAGTWLFRETRELVRRSLKQEEVTEIRTERERAARKVADSTMTPEQMCLTSEMRRIVRTSLSPRELECVLLRSEGLGYEEIAAVMKIAIGTVGATLARAVRKIKTVMDTPKAEGAGQ